MPKQTHLPLWRDARFRCRYSAGSGSAIGMQRRQLRVFTDLNPPKKAANMKQLRSLIALLAIILTSAAHAQQVCPSGNPRNAPDSRYVVDASGTVRDSQTGLIWKQCTEGQTGSTCSGSGISMTWQNALNTANSSAFASFSDWRLPSVKELQSLVEYGCSSPSINLTIFPNTQSDFYWSSTSSAGGASTAWIISSGEGGFSNSNKTITYRVRLVRGGQ